MAWFYTFGQIVVDLNQRLRAASSECFFQISSTRGSIALTLKTSHNFSPQGSPQLILLHLPWSHQLRPRVHFWDFLEVSRLAVLISASFFQQSLSLLWTCPNSWLAASLARELIMEQQTRHLVIHRSSYIICRTHQQKCLSAPILM